MNKATCAQLGLYAQLVLGLKWGPELNVATPQGQGWASLNYPQPDPDPPGGRGLHRDEALEELSETVLHSHCRKLIVSATSVYAKVPCSMARPIDVPRSL